MIHGQTHHEGTKVKEANDCLFQSELLQTTVILKEKYYYTYHTCQLGSLYPSLPLPALGNLKQNVLSILECG